MLSVDQALQLVLQHAQPLPPRRVQLDEALGLVLAEEIVSDIDSPPHDKSVVDGYALRAADIASPNVHLRVLEEVTAGMLPTLTVESGTATRIMTGAPIPDGADAVVMVEQTEFAEGGRVRIDAPTVRPGQNITRRASSLSRGKTVLVPPKRLRGVELGLLAEVGRTSISAHPRPGLAILATGNELVSPSQLPGPGQIRNSNSALLHGLSAQAGTLSHSLGIARDAAIDLRNGISAGLQTRILVLSGGVSAGVLDLVPQVLVELGVEQVFHKVNLKPGKPLWFGVKRHADGQPPTLVFGLPGNPVSSLVCFELFVRPAIQKLSGLAPTGLPRGTAELTKDHPQRGERPTYWPSVVRDAGGKPEVSPLPWKGSGDLATLAGANCLACFPPGERVFKAGEMIGVMHLPS
jgi:molybdopterin molybdotransferase